MIFEDSILSFNSFIRFLIHCNVIFQYLDSEFASKALVKNRKNHELRNTNGGSWSCTVRWAKKRTHECFFSCGWKKFCAANGFQAGDVITFGVDINRSNIINVRKD